MSGRVIVITSGKGGVGKTTTNANIGTALAKAGKKVVMIDTDLGLRNLDLLLGLENRIVYTIVDVVEERCKLKQALVKDKKNPNLCLLAAAQTRDKSAVTEEQLKDICEKLKKDFDFILVDCPAGIEQGFQNAVAGASEAIVVTTPEMSAVRDADRIIGLLESKEEIKSYKLLLNRVRPNLIKSNDMMSVDDVVEILSCPLIGIIPEDTGIITSGGKTLGNIYNSWEFVWSSSEYKSGSNVVWFLYTDTNGSFSMGYTPGNFEAYSVRPVMEF